MSIDWRSTGSIEMEQKIICVKIGGRAATETEALKTLIGDMKELSKDYAFILVHGGGAEVTRVSRAFGIEPEFKNGIRITSREEMDIVEMVLSGKMNKYIVRTFASCGMTAVGLCGADAGLFTGESLSEDTRTGRIQSVQRKILDLLLGASIVPVVSSTSMDSSGDALNINADEAALAIAAEMKADGFLFLSDIDGIMKEGTIIRELSEDRAEREIAAGTIGGGMIPKVRSSISGLKAGIRAIVIGQYKGKGDLSRLLGGEAGTRIIL